MAFLSFPLLFYTRRFSQGYHSSETPLPLVFQTQTLPCPFTFTDKRSFCFFSPFYAKEERRITFDICCVQPARADGPMQR